MECAMECAMECVMELNASDKIRRFCYLGRFDPVYVHLRGTINVSYYRPQLESLCKSLDHNAMLIILKQVLQETTLVRRDEPLFAYAVYLASDVDIVEKTSLRQFFPALILNDEDLFLFCKYAIIIQREKNQKGFTNTVRKAITSWYEHQTINDLRQMWLSHRGGHGFTHQSLLKLCHVNDDIIGAAGVVTPFFKTCTELLKMSEDSENKVDESKSKSSTDVKHSTILAVSKLRTSNDKSEALNIIQKFKLRYHQVPTHCLRSGLVMEALIPTMTLKQLLHSWRYLARYNHFVNSRVMKKCRAAFENKKLLRKENIHPIVFLMKMRDLGICDENSKVTPKKSEAWKISLLKPLYQKSFGSNESTGLRMHITINIQKNYKKKTPKNHKKLAYLEAAVALAFGYFKREKEVNVFYWGSEKHKLGYLHWNKNLSVDEAFKCCDALELVGVQQRLITPIMRAMNAEQVYDVFLIIVPNAGRGNPKNSSEFLIQFLDRYRKDKNDKAKYVIVNLLKFRQSLRYSYTRNENILEICGLDEHTSNLINNFALNRFG